MKSSSCFCNFTVTSKICCHEKILHFISCSCLASFAFSQGNSTFEKEKAAIIKVIEEETNAYINWDYERWKACYLQEEPFARLNSSYGTWGGVDNWATYDSAWRVNYQIEQEIIPLPIKFENEDYIIRITPEAAWAVYTENWFDLEGTKTGWSVGTRFLEKQNGEWKISYMGVHNAGTYEQAAEPENEDMTTE